MKNTPDYKSRFRILKGGKISLVVSALVAGSTMCFASPTGGVVTSGSATIAQSGTTTNITQSTNKATINWNSFGIAGNETVNFNQPNINSITLNRVVGNERSVIDGALNANGQVWILNSNGILFNSTARINTAGILATTKSLSDADFNAGNYKFSGESSASVINMGTIESSDSGYVALLANTVQNDGTIKAYKGTVHLTGASEVTINLNGNSIVSLTVDKGVLDALVENKGVVYADGGKVYLTTNAVDELLKGVVNNTGIIEAKSLDDMMGEVILFAHGGTANISGTIDATGGFVETSGKNLGVAEGTVIKADTWLLDPTDVTISATGADTLVIDTNGIDVSSGPTVSSTAIMEALASTYVIIEASNGDINVNSALTYGGNGLYLKAYNDININADITVNGNARLALLYGWNGIGENYGNRGGINLKMNNAHTAFDAKVALNDASTFWGVGDAGGLPAEYTVIRTREHLSAIDAGYAEFVDAGSSGSIVIQDVTDALDGKYVLGADIDLSDSDWLAIGDYSYPFTGTLNGLGHTIDNLTGLSLFADVDNSDGSISNLGLKNLDIAYGALSYSGYNVNISNIFASGTLTGDWENMGGIFSYVENGTITNVHSHITVPAYVNSGGLVGYGENLNILNSSATGDITYNPGIDDDVEYVGGLIGVLYGGSITNSFATGRVNIPSDYENSINGIGGLAGWIENVTISGSFATGNVLAGLLNDSDSDSYYVGGLVGEVSNWGDSIIENSYATGDVSGNDYVGGLIGDAKGSIIKNSYAIGAVRADTGSDVGGITAASYSNNDGYTGPASIENSYFNSTANPADTSGFGEAKTLEELKTIGTYVGWDFEDTFGISSSMNDGLPYLKWASYMFVPAGPSEAELAAEAARAAAEQEAARLAAIAAEQEAARLAAIAAEQEAARVTEDAITSIVNMQQLTVVLPKLEVAQLMFAPNQVPSVSFMEVPTSTGAVNTPLANFALALGASAGESLSLVSTPESGQQAERITLAEVSQMQTTRNSEAKSDSKNIEVRETRVALGGGSLVELVNGGVSLPEGVQQEFYVVKNNKQAKGKK